MTQIGGLHNVAIRKTGVNVPSDPLEVEPCGSLHPGVGDQNPDCAKMGTKGNHAGCKEVHLRAHFVPAKEKQGQEA